MTEAGWGRTERWVASGQWDMVATIFTKKKKKVDYNSLNFDERDLDL